MNDIIINNKFRLAFSEENGEIQFRGVCSAPKQLLNKGVLPFSYSVAGESHGRSYSMTSFYRDDEYNATCHSVENSRGTTILKYIDEKNELEVKLKIKPIGNSAVLQSAIIKNISDKTVKLTGLSPAVIPFIARENQIKITYCMSTWQGEGHFVTESLKDLNINKVSVHQRTKVLRITSFGTQTTSEYYPEVFVSDGIRTFFYELMPNGSWQIEAGMKTINGIDYPAVSGTCAEENSLAFIHMLKPNEEYASAEVLYGMTEGGVDMALEALYSAKREYHNRNRLKEPLICFNDYMNCLWANPYYKETIALIDRAAEIGADAYVIDAGWFGKKGEAWHCYLGDWKTDTDRFFPLNLKGIAEYIKSKGMRAGIWFEMESVTALAKVYNKPDDWFVTRRGSRIIGEERCFFNFTNAEVRNYLRDKIQTVLDMGYTIIKNDYNDSYTFFETQDFEGLFMLQKNQEAFFEFIDKLISDNPKLVIENCASGAMREDGNTLKHFNFQSVSDQEDYRYYPEIIKGQLMCLLPEQLGVWAMFYPAIYGENFSSPENQKNMCVKFEDCRVTEYNICSAMLGLPYLSGRIDLANDANIAKIKEAVSKYKQLYPFIISSVPFYPLGYNYSERGYECFGLKNEKKAIFSVWKYDCDENQFDIPLSLKSVKKMFDDFDGSCEIYGKMLKVTLAKKYSACIFEAELDND